jgi:hypothetical protein
MTNDQIPMTNENDNNQFTNNQLNKEEGRNGPPISFFCLLEFGYWSFSSYLVIGVWSIGHYLLPWSLVILVIQPLAGTLTRPYNVPHQGCRGFCRMKIGKGGHGYGQQ